MGPITSFSDLMSALRRRFWLIAVIAGFGVPFALWYAINQPRLYAATAVVQIEAAQVAADVAGASAGPSVDSQLNLIEQQLMSRDTLQDVIESYGMFSALPSLTERVAALRGAVDVVRLQDAAQAWRPDAQPTGLSVTVRLTDPEMTAAVANDLVGRIVTEATARSAARASQTLEFVLTEEARVSAAIADVESRIATFREQNLAALPEGLTAQRDRLNRLAEQRIAVDQQIIELASNAGRLRAEEVARQNELLLQSRDVLLAAIAETEAAIAAAPEVERQLGALTRELNQLDAELQVLTARRTEAAMTSQLAAQNQAERYVVLEAALVPDYPVSPSRKKVAATVAVVIGALGVVLALALELLNPAIRTAAQLQKELGVQPVIVIPMLQTRRERRSGLARLVGVLLALLAGAWLLLRDRILALLGAGRVSAPVTVAVAGRRRQ